MNECDRCGKRMTRAEINWLNDAKNMLCDNCDKKWTKVYWKAVKIYGEVKTQRLWDELFFQFLKEKSEEKVIFT